MCLGVTFSAGGGLKGNNGGKDGGMVRMKGQGGVEELGKRRGQKNLGGKTKKQKRLKPQKKEPQSNVSGDVRVRRQG